MNGVYYNMKKLTVKAILAICMLEGERIPCTWSNNYFWRDFEGAKHFNDNYIILLTKKERSNRYFIFSLKENLLVDGWSNECDLVYIFQGIKKFEQSPIEYGK